MKKPYNSGYSLGDTCSTRRAYVPSVFILPITDSGLMTTTSSLAEKLNSCFHDKGGDGLGSIPKIRFPSEQQFQRIVFDISCLTDGKLPLVGICSTTFLTVTLRSP